ncbi:uncharacterized protein B0I36DRAFT_388914 [Microdochium trichocladiopsis]|uniref:Uncharacterized protein n=1 Tax=Microdochium trichocladiopsis TaxID=1682393 RepID=A0A9P9BIZ8_9PEZI|nr:uncharacterized protein B0I36DRAFT_388914 [Microdochium trichocladiopsis]KAH7016256.1 hypothetical protein B0I36DRAFT_388914 [Microdochium trichocladiopsis]
MAPSKSELGQQRRMWIRQKTFRQRNMTPGQKWLDSVLEDSRFKPKRHSVIPTAQEDVLGTLIDDIFHGLPYEVLPYKSRSSKPVTIVTENLCYFESLYRKTNQEAHAYFTNRLDEASFTNFQKQHGPRLVEILRKSHLRGRDGWLCESEIFTCLQLLLETVPKKCIMAPDEAVIPAIEGEPLQLFDHKFLAQVQQEKPKCILLPWNAGHHWVLFLIHLSGKGLFIIDTVPRSNSEKFAVEWAAHFMPVWDTTGLGEIKSWALCKIGKQDDDWSCGYWMLEVVHRICFQKGLLEQNCKAPTALISAGGPMGVDPLLDFIRSAININITEDHLDKSILPEGHRS